MSQINQRQMLPMGAVLDGRYRIVNYLASGGFGNTYVADDLRLGGQVAIKEFFMRGTNHRSADGITVEVSNYDNTLVFNTQLNKFRREAHRIFELHNDHIIHVSDLFDANGTSYYVMDLIPATSLAEQTRQRLLSEQEVRDVALQVLDALETMHNAGLYHLDVKPGNIMRDSRGHCTLIDFGASKQMTADVRATLSSSTMAYTLGYAPHEQVAQQTTYVGPWTDFYALGATLYRLVTGNPPPEVALDDSGPNGRQFHYPVPVGATMRHAISTLMNPIYSKRPQSAAAARALFFTPKPPQGDPPPNKWIWIVLSAVALLALIIGILFLTKSCGSKSKPTPEPDDPEPIEEFTANGVSFRMVRVEGDTFWMGAEDDDKDARDDVRPHHQVTLSDYYIGETEVTQELWQAVMGENPSRFKDAKRPVEKVSWEDCQEFIRKLNDITDETFRLPTEAEWEYAARGGNQSKHYKYAGSNDLDAVAWYAVNSYDKGDSSPDYGTHPVGQKTPNELGIYDISGNVCEWCQDWYDSNYYSISPQSNPCNENSASYRVRRGSSWQDNARSCRVAFRFACVPAIRSNDIGLRLAR